MRWLHTWAGVALGGLSFAIFWMGTLSVFDREIDRWMAPMTRLAVADKTKALSLEALGPWYEAAVAARSPSWRVWLPTEREPAIRLSWRDAAGRPVERRLDPATGAVLPDPGTLAGTRFILPFHYTLHVRLLDIGLWLVGTAAMAMLVLCVSGVVIHRKMFADFFLFRADRKARRLVLDLHNVTGVLGLPFHFLISLSGLAIFWSVYFPSAWQVAYHGDRQAFASDVFPTIAATQKATAGEPGAIASLELMAARARRLWDGDALRYVLVRNPGEARSVVQFGRLGEASVSRPHDEASFDGSTGALIGHRTGTPPVMSAQRFLAGLHIVQFHHWTLRWLYFCLGSMGCVLIATGSLFWLESRRRKHGQLGLSGVRLVEGLTVGAVAGIIAATFAFLVANRVLPLGATFAGYDRAALEVWIFYLVWLLSFAQAWLRPRRAWAEQCAAIALLAIAAVALNWLTTGDHLARSLAHRHLWPVAGMDLLLLAAGAASALLAYRLTAVPPRP